MDDVIFGLPVPRLLHRQVSGPVVVKVCLIVLGVMGIVILLDASVEELDPTASAMLPSWLFQLIQTLNVYFLML